MRLRCQGPGPALLAISDFVVTTEVLESIVEHRRFVPGPRQFHEGRAGIEGTLHRITGVWGLGHEFTADEWRSQPSAEDFLYPVAAKIGRSREDVQPHMNRIVREEWFDTVASFIEFGDEQWEKMRIPVRLVHAIKQRLGHTPAGGAGRRLQGLDLRVGRAVFGIRRPIENILERCTSTLLIGQAGVGKCTMLRERQINSGGDMWVDFTPLIHEPWSSCVILGPAAGARLPALARRLEVLNAMRVPGLQDHLRGELAGHPQHRGPYLQRRGTPVEPPVACSPRLIRVGI